MNEFEEIAHTGGKIEIFAAGSIRYSHNRTGRASMYQLSVTLNGIPLDLVMPRGISHKGNNAKLPDYSVLVMVASDKEGFFGRFCRICKEYFRSKSVPQFGFCPYCGHQAHNIAFTTNNQKLYILAIVELYHKVINEERNQILDLDEIIDSLESNKKNPFIYTEQRQQTLFECSECKNKQDILGLYGFCHACGHRNSLNELEKKLKSISKKIRLIDENYTKFSEQQNELASILDSCVAAFDGFGKDIIELLSKLPAVEIRRKKIKKIKLQKPIEAAETLKNLFDFDILKNFDENNKTLLTKCFNKRHLITHASGIVDEGYIKQTNDISVKLGQIVRIEKEEILKLINLLERYASILFKEYKSIN